MPELFEICIVYKWRYINTFPFLFPLQIKAGGLYYKIYGTHVEDPSSTSLQVLWKLQLQ